MEERIARLRSLVNNAIENYLDNTNFGVLSAWTHGNVGKTRAINCLLLISCPLGLTSLGFVVILWTLMHGDPSTSLLTGLIDWILVDPQFNADIEPLKQHYSLHEDTIKKHKIVKHLITSYISAFDAKLASGIQDIPATKDLQLLFETGEFNRDKYSHRSRMIHSIIYA